MDDQNIKDAEKATQYALLQNKAKEYQDKLMDFRNKDFQGRTSGINIKMKGSFEVVEVKIDQNFYETASKSQIEVAILQCYTNLYHAIEKELNDLNNVFQNDISMMTKGKDIL